MFFLWLEQAFCSVKWAADPSGKFEEDHGNGKSHNKDNQAKLILEKIIRKFEPDKRSEL